MILHTSWRCGKDFPAPKTAALKKTIRSVIALADPSVRCAAVTFLDPVHMAEINMDFLGHEGSTDVICFDYRDPQIPAAPDPDEPEVEIFICPAVALRESRKRGLPYSGEVTLYIVHGFLHAGGYDDLQPQLKRKMRAAERRVIAGLPGGAAEIFPEPLC